ncbi:glycosyltransferase family 2 protein [Tropicibacter naphthalenivorans]|uniref:Poly-beta-1,6-N-acetyl-D-glucosamine synthase n=1 Tax=Tropicibacter naphthalenivorans TaxID=441103 RepID=A0A0P1G0G1_9RHOB|nr:glycosyltransferase family 2 protein [Tropicibacter naphthalenivorans]CUH74962.1 Poly-beta-1,6-N-acetyl-D-glucosamine synthase [Tropicibacter naphthalenivorans]SMC47777.1 Glycosyltransferase, catalytic subunit of cellulose synthase and poly-beta-1,6-N-acetylglucosamine synthase [Tropicibacter naphthalenivorans]
MMLALLVFSLGMVVYVVAGYPLLLLALWRLKGPRAVPEEVAPLRIDFLIPAHNEGAIIRDKIENTFNLRNRFGHELRVLVVSDGSTDDTVAQARAVDDPRLTVVETPGRLGKLGGLNMALEMLDGDIVVFSDANALLSKGTLDALSRHFADPEVGGVCGQITIDEDDDGEIAKADGAYWRYDQAMKRAESDLGGTVSAQGSIYAIRRALTGPIPPGVADDFLMSVRVVEQGFRLAFEPRATTREAVTEHAGNEMARRIRSTEMGWRGLMMMRGLMNPAKHGLYGWQLLSHKGLRRMTPFFLLLAFVANLVLIGQGLILTALGLGQIAFYGIAVLAWLLPPLRRLPGVGKVLFFVLGNLGMALGLFAYLRGKKSSIWTPVRA